ncbi:MAG: bifunctional nuclease family protein [Deltaproteobacteria bacterium]|nr:MAG: bifunctional nuclease family protein [Deltaproteobacteria bacterium]
MTEEKLVSIGEVYLKSDRSSGNMVVLKEKEEDSHHFIMFVGDSEFAAIAKEKGMVEPKRPLTHEFYLRIVDNLSVEFLRIEIYDMKDNTYFANVFFRANGSEHTIDSRPSDAVALALNRKIPILVNYKLFRRELTPEEIKEYEEICKTVKF